MNDRKAQALGGLVKCPCWKPQNPEGLIFPNTGKSRSFYLYRFLNASPRWKKNKRQNITLPYDLKIVNVKPIISIEKTTLELWHMIHNCNTLDYAVHTPRQCFSHCVEREMGKNICFVSITNGETES
jgi:hypothetical protein